MLPVQQRLVNRSFVGGGESREIAAGDEADSRDTTPAASRMFPRRVGAVAARDHERCGCALLVVVDVRQSWPRPRRVASGTANPLEPL
jgi:hypothetical protein